MIHLIIHKIYLNIRWMEYCITKLICITEDKIQLSLFTKEKNWEEMFTKENWVPKLSPIKCSIFLQFISFPSILHLFGLIDALSTDKSRSKQKNIAKLMLLFQWQTTALLKFKLHLNIYLFSGPSLMLTICVIQSTSISD